MLIYIISAGYWFCVVVQWALFAYIILSWLPISERLRAGIQYIMDPLLAPIRRLIDQSILKMRGIDLSPIILYLLVTYGARICLALR